MALSRLSLEIVNPFLDRCGQLGIHGKSVAGETDGRLGGITKADGSVPFEEGKPGIRGGGDDGLQDAFRNRSRVVALEKVARRRPGPGSETIDGDDLAGCREMDDGRCDPPEAAHVGLHHVQRDAGRHSRVDGVAPGLEHQESGFRPQVVPRRHDVSGSHEVGTMRPGTRGLSHHDLAPAIFKPIAGEAAPEANGTCSTPRDFSQSRRASFKEK